MNPRAEPLLFALNASRDFGERVSRGLGWPLQAHEEREFEDGEHKSRPLVNVRGRDVFVVHSLYGEPGQSVNDKLCRLLFFAGALKDADAARVTAVVPYLPYARKDRKTKLRDPVTSRYVAVLMEAAGVDHVIGMEVHNPAAFQNAFRCRTDHLESAVVLSRYFAESIGREPVVVMSPDPGGVRRAERFQALLSEALGRPVDSAYMEKRRSAGVVSGSAVVGTVTGCAVVIVDDLISTGGTIIRAANACRERGAGPIDAAAAHGLFMGDAAQALGASPIRRIVITDTVPPLRLGGQDIGGRLVVVDVAPLFAEAVRAVHEGGSIGRLMQP